MNLIELTLKKGFKVTEVLRQNTLQPLRIFSSNFQQVYVDTVGDPEKYRRKLRYKFPEIDITVSKKADSLYASVSAASICAKVTRDHVLAHWQFTEKNLNASTEFGSGYPSGKSYHIYKYAVLSEYSTQIRRLSNGSRKILTKYLDSRTWSDSVGNLVIAH